MKEILFWLFVISVTWFLQTFLTSKQIKKFNNELIKLRKIGEVSIGKVKGGFKSGCILIIVVDKNSKRILTSKIIKGITVFAKLKDFSLFDGLTMEELFFLKDDLELEKIIKKALESILKGGK